MRVGDAQLVRASLPIPGDPRFDSHPRHCGSLAPIKKTNNKNEIIITIK